MSTPDRLRRIGLSHLEHKPKELGDELVRQLASSPLLRDQRPGRGCFSKIVSGGQTGADRAALDWAIAHGVQHGGWCPRGRKAEDGAIDAKYELAETVSDNYRARTIQNVRDSDATLILNLGELDGGSLETLRAAEREGKPVRVVQLDTDRGDAEISELSEWVRRASVLNIAGPRESKRPGIYAATFALLDRLGSPA